MTRPWLRRALVVGILAGAALILRFTVFRPKEIPVAVFRAESGRVEETVTNSRAGTVKSRRRASLSPETGGRVAELPVRKGAAVRTGDVILRLNTEDARAQLTFQERSRDAVRAAEREACAAAVQAERDLERNRRLFADAVVSQSLLDQFQSRRDTALETCAAARARARQADAAIGLAGVALDKTTLRAPFDGIVAEIDTEVGEWIMPSPAGVPMPSVVEIIDPSAIYVSAPLDEVDVARVRAGLPVRVTMDAYAGKSFPGRVVRVSRYVRDDQEQNRTFEVEVEFDDPAFGRTLVPGSSADVEVVLDAREGALRVPSYAVLDGERVLVARDGIARGIEVGTGLRNWQFTEIVSGLAPGDPVITTLDKVEVKDGARVTISGEAER
jgi:HlyD family secretion protein